ncbi:MAG: GntR family transcriptional regulator [Bacteroidales bacterium]|nr:GntR family transcriptional regulator [Bacteroidales bacterium]
MDFDNNKPIYLQISDNLCEHILAGDLRAEDRILSVRELGAEIGVNPNTVARAYEKLTDAGIIYTKRGLGYYVAPGAREVVLEAERKAFLETEWPKLLKRASLLDIDLKKLL